jgi:ketosteroid isomerase-like protein
VDGLVTELLGRRHEQGQLITDRRIMLCTVRAGRINELTVYWNGDWDEALRARHAAQTTLERP